MGTKAPKPPSSAEPAAIKQLRVQTSAYGNVIPLVYGETRVAGNIVWAGYFKAIRHDQSSGTGKGGRVAIIQYTYTASVLLCLGERERENLKADLGTATTGITTTTTKDDGTQDEQVGPSAAHSLWRVKKVRYAGDRLPNDLARTGRIARVGVGFSAWTVSGGLSGQSDQDAFFVKPDALPASSGFTGVQATNPNLRLVYPGLAVMAGQDVHLDSNAGFPNLNVPFRGLFPFLFRGIVDAHPYDILLDLLTHPARGAGVPANMLGDWSTGPNGWYQYCAATDLLLSPSYDSQQSAKTLLEELALITNTAIVFSEGLLKMRPYGDEGQTSAKTGITYDPTTPTNPHGADLTNRADLGDDDFWHTDQQPAVRIERKQANTVFNVVHVEYLNAQNAYAAEIAEAVDEGDIQVHGPRAQESQRFHAIVHRLDSDSMARQVAQRLLQKQLSSRNLYHFSLGFRHVLLEPMDVVTLTDLEIGLDHTPVRLTAITETEEGRLECEAEDFPGHVSESQTYLHQGASGAYTDYNAVAPPATDVTVFEPPATLVSQAELWILARGGGDNWGGAMVFFSEDDATYFAEGTLHAAIVGTLLDPIAVQARDDRTTVARVQLGGDATTRSVPDAQGLRTLAYLGNGGNTYELVAYSTLQLVFTVAPGVRIWQLQDYLRRGAYDRPIVAHSPGERVALLTDGHILAIPIPVTLIGKTIYVKLVSFNLYGGGEQAIEDVDPVYVHVNGTYHASPLPDVIGAQLRFADGYALLAWDPVITARPVDYEIRLGTTWETATVQGRTKELRFAIQGSGTYWIAAHYSVETGIGTLHAYSATPTDVSVAGTGVLVRNVVSSFDDAAFGWPGRYTQATDAILGASLAPAVYLPLSTDAVDWSGYELSVPFVLGGSGGATGAPGLIPGDPDHSTALLGNAYVQSTSLGTHVNTQHDLTLVLRVKRAATGGSDQWLWDGRDTSTRATLHVSFYGASGLLNVYRGTTLLLSGSGAITDTQPHTVLVRARYIAGAPASQRRLELWLDGTLVGQTDVTQQWSQYSQRSTIGAIFSGTNIFNGWVQAFAWWPAAVSDADIAAISSALSGGITSGLVTNVDGSLRLVTTSSGVALRGVYYPPPGERVALRSAAGETRLAASVTGFAYFPWSSVNAIPAPFDAIAGLEGRLGDHVQIMAEVSTLPATVPNGGRWQPYRPLLPRTYSDLGFRERLVITTDDPTIAVALTDAALTVDVPDMVQQAQHVAVGIGLTLLLGTAGGVPPIAPYTITVPGRVPAGDKIIVLVAVYMGGNTFPPTITVTDSRGNVYHVDYAATALFAPAAEGPQAMQLEALSADVVTDLQAGDLLTVTVTVNSLATTVYVGIMAAAFQGLLPGAAFDSAGRDTQIFTTSLTGAGVQILTTPTSPGFLQSSELVLGLFALVGPGTDVFRALDGQLLAQAFAGSNSILGALYVLAPDTTGIALRAQYTTQFRQGYVGAILPYRSAAAGNFPGSTTITFPQPFNTDRPTVTVGIEDAQPGDAAAISGVTAQGFTIAVKNSAGFSVPRLVSYVAQGY